MILDSFTCTLADSPRHSFDLFINATGYEERASSLFRHGCVEAPHYISALFPNHRILAFNENVRIMQDVSATLVENPVEFFRAAFEDLAKSMVTKLGRTLRIGLDVSSMNRTMAATVLLSLFACQSLIVSLNIFYVPGRFKPPKLSFSPIQQIGAVTPELSGFDSEPGLPLALILGLGFEYGTAVGIINQLEPQATLCFRAIGHDTRFE